ncbi:hypothetical protein [Winogradskyella sp.]|uniref:hypothetical protein n=1 Tax=Winogradskyella sp. TaxID=1883156 RepID=UPI002600FAC9|nr:hypothetical protein [Winogradskyella sp.]
MAPIKFEEQLKDKLEKRTLSPSADGWSKLSERLYTDEKKSKNPIFWWLSIAAGLIIMIAVSIQFFNNGDSEEVIPQVVEDQVEKEQIENIEKNLNNTESIELVIEGDILKDEKGGSPVADEPQIIDYKKTAHKKSKSKTQLAESNNSSIKTNVLKQAEDLKKELPMLTNKSMMKDAVASALKDLKSENASVTDREIDSLLKLASKELVKDKLQNKASKIVDANALLMSVEDEMGQSFRSKVFDALKDSYETVKTAVAERNN